MPRSIAITHNVARLNYSYDQIKEREHPEGMLVCWGAPGYGKTTAACELFVRERGIIATANAVWTPKAMLHTLLRELGSDTKGGSNSDLLDELIGLVAENSRPIFIDDAQFLFNSKKMLDCLRAVHDVAGSPILLIGQASTPAEPGIEKRIKKFPQVADRVSHWVEFFPADIDDTRLIAEKCCSVEVDEPLLEALCKETKGNLRRIRLELARIQRYGLQQKLRICTLERWNNLRDEIAEREKRMRAVG